ncbi:GNAT family N-acetyltransferase [Haloechinothrix sp. LS1_15]|uniref:GNAT family N-acetyltransferase n=1 Tax=Haloechinothrix sp. LS1_15 TaxID=2652248 RepID=UPI00294AF5AF|nr:GNAT family N-acetyltransferase [Haloechinothrix sp. LS1_15]
MRCVDVDPRSDACWAKLAACQAGCLFTSPPWLEAICGTFGLPAEARLALDASDRPVAGFAWVPVNDLRGTRYSALPFSDRADPMVTDVATWQALSADALSAGVPLTVRCWEDAAPARDSRMVTVGGLAWHGTPLDAPLDELYRRLSGTARRNIARARRAGVRVVATAEQDAMHAFHRLHLRLRKRKYRLLAQPPELFDRIWQSFAPRDAVVTLLAYEQHTLIAGAVFLVWNDVLYYKFGASLHEHLALRPNDALFWAGIEWGARRNLAWVDWGCSDDDQPGLIAYKRKWASEQRRIVTLRQAEARSPGHHEADALLGELTALLTEESVPDHVTARAGRLLYRYFC